MNEIELKLEKSAESIRSEEGWYLCPRCPRCLTIAGHWRGIRLRKRRGPVHRRCCTRCTRWFYAELESERPLALDVEDYTDVMPAVCSAEAGGSDSVRGDIRPKP
jgi:hypothetical protein